MGRWQQTNPTEVFYDNLELPFDIINTHENSAIHLLQESRKIRYFRNNVTSGSLLEFGFVYSAKKGKLPHVISSSICFRL